MAVFLKKKDKEKIRLTLKYLEEESKEEYWYIIIKLWL